MMFLENPWIFHHDSCLHYSSNSDGNRNSGISSVAVSEYHDSIAVATQDGIVTVYVQSGKSLENSLTLTTDLVAPQGESYCSQICWLHNSSNVLVAGRADGQIICIDVLPPRQSDDDRVGNMILTDNHDKVHSNKIIDFIWNESQDDRIYLLSVDGSGCCCLWKTENNTALLPVMRFDNDGKVNAAVFLESMFPLDQKCNQFLYALDNSNLYLANETGDCNEIKVIEHKDPIKVIHCSKDGANNIFLITESMELILLNMQDDGTLLPGRSVKLSIQLSFERDTLLSTHGHLICMTKKGTIQCFDLNSYETYEFKFPTDTLNSDKPLSIASNSKFIVTYSQSHRCTFWSFDAESKTWLIVSSILINEKMDNVSSSYLKFAQNSLAVISKSNLCVVHEKYSQSVAADSLVALQTGLSTVAIFNELDQGAFAVLDTGMIIHGIRMDMRHICVWGATEIHVYKIDGSGQCELFSEVTMKSQCVVIYEDTLFIAKDALLLVTDLFGAQRLTISLLPDEGNLHFLDVSCDILAMMTSSGTVKTMDIRNKEPKLLTSGKLNLEQFFLYPSLMISLKCNADGRIMSILSERTNGSHQLHLFDTTNMSIVSLDNLCGNDCLITSHCWDPAFPRVFACETRSKIEMKSRVLMLFVSGNLAVDSYANISNTKKLSRLTSLNLPSKLFISMDDSVANALKSLKLQKNSVEGFEDTNVTSNAESLSALVDFAYYLTSGDLDKAYLCLLPIKSSTTWYQLSKACVIQNRVDIAERCLAKLGNGIGVAAVRKAEKEVALAEVAIQLGMLDEAEKLYKKWDRPDLLCDLYRRQDRWNDAFAIVNGSAKEQSLQYHYNKKLHISRQQDEYYSKNMRSSLASKKAKLKQLIIDKKPVDSFLRQVDDIKLFQWYASYVESTGDLKKAKELYELTCDTLSLVRLACLEGNLTDAFTLVRESKSCVAAYHLARHLEANGDIEGAISCFARSSKFNYAIRLSKAYGIEKYLMHFALHSAKPLKIECANYLEGIGQIEKATELLIEAGEKEKALDLFVRIPFDDINKLQVDILSIIDGLENKLPKDVIMKCTVCLMRSGEHKNAFKLLQRQGLGVDICLNLYVQNQIPLTEAIAHEALTHCKEDTKKKYLIQIASIYKTQGNYVLASEKFSQGGDPSSAIKCLLLTGDVESIISYAFTSETKDVFIIAANYLQTINDYYHDADIKKSLLQLYSKAKSNRHLFHLMCSWSTFEASDGEYEVAVRFLSEAEKYGSSESEWVDSDEEKWVKRNIQSMRSLMMSQNIAATDQLKAQQLCIDILKDYRKGDLVELGDCYALLVQIENDNNKAFVLIEEMIKRGLSPEEYIEEETIRNIYASTKRIWKGDNDDSQESSELE